MAINSAIDKIKLDKLSEEDGIIVIEKEKVFDYEVEFVKTLLRYGHLPFNDKFPYVYLYMLDNNPAGNFQGITVNLIITDYWECLFSEFIPDLDRYTSFPIESVSAFATSLAFEDFQISQSWEGHNEFNPQYINKVQSAVSFFKVYLTKEKIKQNELLISNCGDESDLGGLLENNRILKNNFRILATRAGISFML